MKCIIPLLVVGLLAPSTLSSPCDSSICREEADRILSNLNPSVNPCSDFFEFACGNYPKAFPRPQGRLSYNQFNYVADSVIRDINLFLQDKEIRNLPPLGYVKKVINECRAGQLGSLDELRKVYSSTSGFPLGNIEGEGDFFKGLAKVIADTGISAFFDFDISNINLNGVKTNVLAIFRPKRLTGAYSIKEQVYERFVGLKSSSQDDEMAYAIHSLASLFSPHPDKMDVEELVQFLNRYGDLKKTLDRKVMTMKFKQLEYVYDKRGIMKTLINDIFTESGIHHKIKGDDHLLIASPDFYSLVLDLMSRTRDVTLKNALAFDIFLEYGMFGPPEVRNIFMDLMKALHIDLSTDLKSVCYDYVITSAPHLMARPFVDIRFTNQTKAKSVEMIKNIMSTMHEIITEKDWMQNITKVQAIKKLRSIRINDAYPDFILNDTALNEMYDFGSFRPTILSNMANIKGVTFKSIMKQIGKPDIKGRYNWPIGSMVINAAYSWNQNSITIPAVMHNIPYFHPDVPPAMQYGGLGHVIGHEITHGFDNNGAAYDWEGKYRNWWDTKTKIQFIKKGQEMEKQYSSVFLLDLGEHVNGSLTLGENIADNGGMKATYRSYKKLINSSDTLSGLNFTSDQLFFLSYANNWCENTDITTRRNKNKDVHALNNVRVNVVLSNFKEFAQSFECSASSPMVALTPSEVW